MGFERLFYPLRSKSTGSKRVAIDIDPLHCCVQEVPEMPESYSQREL